MTPSDTAARRRFWRDALIVVLVALAARAMYFDEIRSSPFFDVPVIDAATYEATAQTIASGSWLNRPPPCLIVCKCRPHICNPVNDDLAIKDNGRKAIEAVLHRLC